MELQQWCMWRQFYYPKWNPHLTIIPKQLPKLCRLQLHNFTAHWHCNPAEFSQHENTVWHLVSLRLSRDQRWPFKWLNYPSQTLWQWDPGSHPIQPEPIVDKVRYFFNSSHYHKFKPFIEFTLDFTLMTKQQEKDFNLSTISWSCSLHAEETLQMPVASWHHRHTQICIQNWPTVSTSSLCPMEHMWTSLSLPWI